MTTARPTVAQALSAAAVLIALAAIAAFCALGNVPHRGDTPTAPARTAPAGSPPAAEPARRGPR